MNTYKRINTLTKRLAKKQDYLVGTGFTHKAEAYSDKWGELENDKFALVVVQDPPAYDPKTEQLARLPDVIDEVNGEWTITTNIFEVVPNSPEVAPSTISLAQLKQELIERDLDEGVDNAIAEIPDKKTRKTFKNWYNNALTANINSSMLITIATQLGIDDEEKRQDFFLKASKHEG